MVSQDISHSELPQINYLGGGTNNAADESHLHLDQSNNGLVSSRLQNTNHLQQPNSYSQGGNVTTFHEDMSFNDNFGMIREAASDNLPSISFAK